MPAIEKQGTLITTIFDDKSGRFTFAVLSDDGGACTIPLNTMKWVEESRSYEPDEELYNAASEVLESILPGTTVENAVDTLNSIPDVTVTYYVADEDAEVGSFSPNIGAGGNYTQFVKLISAAQARELDGKTVELTKFEEFKGVRFNIGFKYKFNGEDLFFRVSTLSLPPLSPEDDDRTLSVKYGHEKNIKQLREQIENKQIGEDQVKRTQQVIDGLVAKSRAKKVVALEDFLNQHNIEDLIENPEPIEAKLKSASFGGEGGKVYYLIAEVL
jgi:hypothetical protein